MAPLAIIGVVAAIGIGVFAYSSIEAQLMRQLRYRAIQLIDTIAIAGESLDDLKELQHVVLAMSVSPDASLIVLVDQNQRIIAASRSNLIDRQADREHAYYAADLEAVSKGRERFVRRVNGADYDFIAPLPINAAMLDSERAQQGAVLVRMDVRAIRRDLIREALQVASCLILVVVLLSFTACGSTCCVPWTGSRWPSSVVARATLAHWNASHRMMSSANSHSRWMRPSFASTRMSSS